MVENTWICRTSNTCLAVPCSFPSSAHFIFYRSNPNESGINFPLKACAFFSESYNSHVNR